MDLSVSRSARCALAQPAHRRQRLLRLRRRVRRRRRPVDARRAWSRRGCSSRRPRGHPPRAHRRDAGGHAQRHRPAGHRRPPLHQGKAARAAPAAGPPTIVNICGSTLDEYVELARILSDAEGVARARAEHLLPEHQGRRHHVRLQPARHLRRGERGEEGDAPAGHPQAHAQRHRRRLDCQGRRRCRRRRRLARQHVPRHGHRRRDAPAEAVEHRRRPERPGDPADCRAHGLRVPPRREDSRHRHGRDRHAPPTRSSS